jgi:hypothetical protein
MEDVMGHEAVMDSELGGYGILKVLSGGESEEVQRYFGEVKTL